MKLTTILMFFLCILVGCKKEEVHTYSAYNGRPQSYTGTATATRNGKPWTCSFYAFKGSLKDSNSGYTVYLDNYVKINGKDYRRDQIKLHNLQLQPYLVYPKTYFTLSGNQTGNKDTGEIVEYLRMDIDAIDGVYQLLPTISSFIDIKSFNSQTQELSGTFSFDFQGDEAPKDTIRFRNGVFSGKVYDSFFP